MNPPTVTSTAPLPASPHSAPRWRHLCAIGGLRPGKGDNCPACQEAERLPRPVTPQMGNVSQPSVIIPVSLARQCLTGLDCHLSGIEDRLRLRALPYATRTTLERARREYAAATAALTTAIAAAR